MELYRLCRHQVHPRVCGVLRDASAYKAHKTGSSPRVRGFGERLRPGAPAPGFIPACAGFCIPYPARLEQAQVHPRVCGVLALSRIGCRLGPGSSPRVRGFGASLRIRQPASGFIPACAGFCAPRSHGLLHSEVHPRVCGVLRTWTSLDAIEGGSSPRVRGFVGRSADAVADGGFIPACAGF